MLDGVQRYPLSLMFPMVCVKAVFCLHYLFNLYIDRLSVTLSKTKVGCALGTIMVNHLAYADDLVILSPSAKGLQKLLNICSEYGTLCSITNKRNVCIFQSKVVLLLMYPRFSQICTFCDGSLNTSILVLY